MEEIDYVVYKLSVYIMSSYILGMFCEFIVILFGFRWVIEVYKRSV